MAVTQKILKGSAWIVGTRLMVNGLNTVSVLILARLLSPEDFGLVAVATTMMMIMTTITDFQVNQALIHQSELTDDHLHTAWTLNVVRALFIGIIFCSIAGLISNFYDDERLAALIYALSISLVINGFVNPKWVNYEKDLVFWPQILLVFSKLFGVIASIIVAYVYETYWALVVNIIIGSIATLIMSYAFMRYLPKISFKYFNALWSFSFWLLLSQLFNTINWRSDQLIIGKFLGVTALGAYNIGDKLASLPTNELSRPVVKTLFPAFAGMDGDIDRMMRAYQRAQTFLTALSLPLGVGMAVIAEPLVYLVLGEKWVDAIIILQVIGWVFAMQTIGSQVRPVAMALGRTRMLSKVDFLIMILRIPIISFGAISGGIIGLLIARGLTGLLSIIVNMCLVSYLLQISIWRQFFANIRCFVAVGCMALIVWHVMEMFPDSLEQMNLMAEVAILVSVGCLSYMFIIIFIWYLQGKPVGPEDEFLSIMSKAKKRLANG